METPQNLPDRPRKCSQAQQTGPDPQQTSQVRSHDQWFKELPVAMISMETREMIPPLCVLIR